MSVNGEVGRELDEHREGVDRRKRELRRTFLIIDFLDLITATALFFAAGSQVDPYNQYLKSSVQGFVFQESLFDVFCIAVGRSILLFLLHLNLTRFEKIFFQFLAFSLPLLSFIYLATKLGLAIGNGLGNVPGGAIFAGFILGTQIIFTIVETYQASTIPRIIRLLTYSPLSQEAEKEKALQSRIDEENDKSNASFLRLLGLAKPEIKILTLGMIALFLNSIASAALPFIIGIIVDALVEGEEPELPEPPTFFKGSLTSFVTMEDLTPREKLNSSIVLLVIIFSVFSVFGLIRGWLFTLAGQRVVARLRKDVFAAIISQEIAFFDKTRTGELTSRLTSDTQIIQNAVTSNISMLVRYLVQILISVAILFLVSWQLTLVMFSVVPVIAIGAVIYGRYIQRLQKTFQDELGAATSVAEEVISNLRTVRSFSKEAKSRDLYGQAVHKSYLIGTQIAIAYGTFQGVVGFIPQLAIALILWYGGSLVLDGLLTTGRLTSFLLYTLSVAMALAFLSSLFGDFMQAVGASSRIFQLLDRVPAIPIRGGETIVPLKGHVEFQQVTFSYPTRLDSKILNDVNLKLNPGSVLALVGPSGGGKSTIVSLMERFYDVLQGAVLIDGVDLKQLDPEWYRSQVALVSQEPVLFANTIKENIVYGVERQVTMEEIIEAATSANAHSFISGFTDGYETQVGERGIKLSGGQKQRIAIARALLMNPKILLLDEATSALDSESEYLVQDAIERAMKGRTVLIIAHRLSTIKNADVIAVLAGGKIVEMGSHHELLELDGLYKKLVNRQMQTGVDSMQEVFADVAKELNETEQGSNLEEKS